MDRWWCTYTCEHETQSLKTSFLFSPASFSLLDKPILRTGLPSLIAVREASEANSDHCLVSGKITFLPLWGPCWFGDSMPDTFRSCCWCLTRLWQWVMWLPYITFCKTTASPIKMQLLHCPCTHHTGPHTCTTAIVVRLLWLHLMLTPVLWSVQPRIQNPAPPMLPLCLLRWHTLFYL